MTGPDMLLKTSQVADYLGVSVSTAKRWIDSGQFESVRTVGKHRLVPRTSLIRFAARGRVAAESLSPPPAAPVSTGDLDAAACELEKLLRAARFGDAERLVASVHEGFGAVVVGDRLIRPVMERIGHGWLVGSWEIHHEHGATQAMTGIIQRRIAATPRPDGPRPIALGASVEGDVYRLPGLLCELTLAEVGWEVRNLGVDLPFRSLAAAVAEYRPRLAFLPTSRILDPDRFASEYSFFYEAAVRAGTAIIIGGRALDPEIRPRLVFASCGDRMAHLAEFARRLLAAPGVP